MFSLQEQQRLLTISSVPEMHEHRFISLLNVVLVEVDLEGGEDGVGLLPGLTVEFYGEREGKITTLDLAFGNELDIL
jgi:hypothetical protein